MRWASTFEPTERRDAIVERRAINRIEMATNLFDLCSQLGLLEPEQRDLFHHLRVGDRATRDFREQLVIAILDAQDLALELSGDLS